MSGALYLSLGLYCVLMLVLGFYGYRNATSSASDFLLGGRRLHPAVGALSAGASDMSGWMLMGLPGALFVSGLPASWIGIGLFVGAYINYRTLAPRLRVYTEQTDDALTLPAFLARRFDGEATALRVVASLVIIIFFTVYTASGLVAGGKLFETAFALSYSSGVALTASIVVAYTLIGGFLAVSLTDFVQGMIMLVALLLVPWMAVEVTGGLDAAAAALRDGGRTYDSLFEGTTTLGIFSAAAWGLGYFGQPHIIVRFMAIRSARDMPTARRIGMSWMALTLTGAVATGLVGYAYVRQTDTPLPEPETIFIVLSQTLFHPLVAGFLIAAILAAIMSTISSQLLVSASSLSEDCYRQFLKRPATAQELVLASRVSIVAVALLAARLAWDSNTSILALVGNAWAGFGAAFGPVLLLALYWDGLTARGALAGMVSGALIVLLWIFVPIDAEGTTLSALLYEIIPGFLGAALAAVAISRIDQPVSDAVRTRHESVRQALAS